MSRPPSPRDSGCTVLHVDMDAFYVSVSLLERPDLKGRPVVVGGGGNRGVVLSASYEARRFGIRSAMPMGRARRLCPQVEVLRPDHRRYAEVSRGVMELFRSVTPLVEPVSVDEAFLDVSGSLRRLGTPTEIAEHLRVRVADEQRITCSVGVAGSKLVAKLAASRCKPDGLLVVPVEETVAFLHPLPVGALWGVGERTEAQLTRLGLRTVGDLAHVPEPTLRRAVGDAAGRHLHELAWGHDPRPVLPGAVERTVGAEETFSRDVDDPEVVLRELLRLSERTAARLRATGAAGRTVVLKVRFADMSTITRSRTLPEATDLGRVVYGTARELWSALRLERARIRLVGVRVDNLVDAAANHQQLTLDGEPESWRQAERAVDRAAARFGAGSVRPAALLAGDRAVPDRPGAAPDRPRAAPDRPGAAPDRPGAAPDRPKAGSDRQRTGTNRPWSGPDRLRTGPDR